MCPSFRVTRNERDLTRGRANTLRLALSGQLGADGLASPEAVGEALSLCVSCKGCRRDCPTGVDMARMKIEVLHQQAKVRGAEPAPEAGRRPCRAMPAWPLAPCRGSSTRATAFPALAWLTERLLGLSARRALPRWRSDTFLQAGSAASALPAPPAARQPMAARRGRAVGGHLQQRLRARYPRGGAARCCRPPATPCTSPVRRRPTPNRRGRCAAAGPTLSAGLVDEARAEARRTLRALAPRLERGATVVGLEPSCLLTMRDEFLAMKLGDCAAAGRRRLRRGRCCWRSSSIASRRRAG